MKLITLSMDMVIIVLSFRNIYDGVFLCIMCTLDLVI